MIFGVYLQTKRINMELINIDSLIDLREFARSNGNYELSDKIRNKLIQNSVFIIDTKEGQEVYHEKK